jgi:hypothetical protein
MSTKKTIQIQKSETPERHLLAGANTLMKEFKTPAIFLEFLTQSLYWMDLYNNKNKEAKIDSYFIKMMLTEIVQPWLKNGAEATKEIEIGIKDLQDFCGYKGYHKYISSIILGFTIELADTMDYDSRRKYFLMFNTMYEIGDFITAYEMDLYIEGEKEKLEKAA